MKCARQKPGKKTASVCYGLFENKKSIFSKINTLMKHSKIELSIKPTRFKIGQFLGSKL